MLSQNLLHIFNIAGEIETNFTKHHFPIRYHLILVSLCELQPQVPVPS